ncbi:hypothetical protein HanHA300_Chr14g0515481 [Helianthus annuus]|nr:hypothetical protein HanHA300_Chr14g0515481 [Helianthus annuus]
MSLLNFSHFIHRIVLLITFCEFGFINLASFFSFIGLKVGTDEKESTALTLLRLIWKNILQKPKEEIESILKGPPSSVKQDHKTVSGRAIQAMQLKKLIHEHVAKMKEETNNIITDSTNQSTTVNEEQVVQLENLISERLVTMHDETQKIIKGSFDSIKQDSSEGDLALKLQNLIFKHIAKMHDKTQKTIETIKMEDQAPKLKKVILKQIKKMDVETQKIISETRLTKKKHTLLRYFLLLRKWAILIL